MSNDSASEGLVSRTDIADLALLFDRFEYSIDPISDDCRMAEVEFEDRVERLYSERALPNYPTITLMRFRCHVRSLCRQFLKKN